MIGYCHKIVVKHFLKGNTCSSAMRDLVKATKAIRLAPLAAVSVLVVVAGASAEWPVFFEHLGFVHSIHNKWDLTLNVKLYLPSLEARLAKTLHRLDLLRGHQHDPEPDRPRASGPSKLQELQESWQTLNRHLTRRCETLKRRSSNLRGLAKSRPKRRRRQAPPLLRFKRQDDGGLAAGNGVLQTLFGIAYYDDIKRIHSQLKTVESKMNNDLVVVKDTQSHLEQETEQELTLQKSKMAKVEDMAHELEAKVRETVWL